MQLINGCIRLFSFWALLLSGVALFAPYYFVPLKAFIMPLLIIVMLGMGLTLTWQDFLSAINKRQVIFIGVLIQFLIMPFAAFFLSLLFHLSLELTVGMILVGSTAGGTASNMITYLAKGDVALSVSMTLVSTLLAVIALPLLTWLYLGQMVQVPVMDMLFNLVKLILLPVLLGTTLNSLFHQKFGKITPLFPLVSMLAIIVIIAIVVALNQPNLATIGWSLVVAVILHNGIGLASGYWFMKMKGYDDVIARTVAIEVGMQNSGLSVALAIKYFSAASALPGAMFSIWHNLSGSLLASYFQSKQERKVP